MTDGNETRRAQGSADRREFIAASIALAVPGANTLAVEAADDRTKPAGEAAPTVLITGSNRGIGLEFARRYAARGWRVIATCRHPAAAAALHELTAGQPRVVVEALDVADHATVDALAAKYARQPIDVLLNNAGIGGGSDNQAFGRLRYDVFPQLMKVNAEGPIKMCEAFLAQVAASGQKKMITVSSSQGSIGRVTMPMLYWYRSSKAAVNMLMRNLAFELKGRGIVVGLVTPGPTDTDFMAGLPKKMLRPVADAVTDMMREIDGLDLSRTGQFLGFKGDVLPW